MSSPAQGHNSGVQGERLRSFIERIERLSEEKAALVGDINEVFAEAKSAGYDVRTMRAVIKLRKMDAADRQEQEALLETYMRALGDYASTPLGLANSPEVRKMRADIAKGEVSIEMEGKRIEADGKGGVHTVEVENR